MAQVTARELLKEAAEHLPDSASVEEAIERVVLLDKIERGLADADAGRVISHDDVKRRLGV